METQNRQATRIVMLSPREVKARIEAGTACLVDVRERHENAQARLSGARLVPLSAFDPARIAPRKGQELILHCRSGQRCGVAAERLLALGYPGTIHRMSGGILEWIAQGLPVETG